MARNSTLQKGKTTKVNLSVLINNNGVVPTIVLGPNSSPNSISLSENSPTIVIQLRESTSDGVELTQTFAEEIFKISKFTSDLLTLKCQSLSRCGKSQAWICVGIFDIQNENDPLFYRQGIRSKHAKLPVAPPQPQLNLQQSQLQQPQIQPQSLFQLPIPVTTIRSQGQNTTDLKEIQHLQLIVSLALCPFQQQLDQIKQQIFHMQNQQSELKRKHNELATPNKKQRIDGNYSPMTSGHENQQQGQQQSQQQQQQQGQQQQSTQSHLPHQQLQPHTLSQHLLQQPTHLQDRWYYR